MHTGRDLCVWRWRVIGAPCSPYFLRNSFYFQGVVRLGEALSTYPRLGSAIAALASSTRAGHVVVEGEALFEVAHPLLGRPSRS